MFVPSSIGMQNVTLSEFSTLYPCGSSIAWELPHNVPFEAKEILILEFLHLWHEPSRSCFQDVFSNLVKFTDGLITKHFGRFKQLERHIRYQFHDIRQLVNLTSHRVAVRGQLEATRVQGIQALETTLALEKSPLYAADLEGFDTARLEWLKRYQNAFNQANPPHLYHDRFEDELIVIAEVRAYFDLAHRVSSWPAV